MISKSGEKVSNRATWTRISSNNMDAYIVKHRPPHKSWNEMKKKMLTAMSSSMMAITVLKNCKIVHE